MLGNEPIDPQEAYKAGQKAAATQNKITPGSSPLAKLSRISGIGLGALMMGGLKAADVAMPEGEGAAKKVGQEGIEVIAKGVDKAAPAIEETVNSIKKLATSKPAQEAVAVERLAPKNLFPKELPPVNEEKGLLETFKKGEPAPTPSIQKTESQLRIPEGNTPGGVPSEAPRELSSYSEGVTPSGENVKQTRLDVSEGAKKSVEEGVSVAKPRIEEVVGKKLTNKEVEQYARDTGKIMEETVGRDVTLQRAAENLNLRREIAKVAENGKITPDFIELLVRDRAASADTARQLQARKIMAKPDQLSKIDTVIDAVTKREKDFQKVIDEAKNVDWNDANAITEFYRAHVKPNVGEWIDTLRYNSMLSSPLTHIQNVASNFQGTALVAPIEKAIAGGVDAIKSALTGGPRTKYAGESLHYVKGYLENVGNAARALRDSLSGKNFGSIPDLIDVPMYTKGPMAKVEKVLKAPVRLLEASDQFFNALVEGGVKRSLAYRMSKG
ncbi:MAG TPA: hypothetical protein PLI01_00005, partial [Nitrospira sp.]|nr:hypothetical protein [Nitrospira sp.]